VEIVRPSRLVFAFSVPKYSAQVDRVTVEITPSGGACVLTLTHERVDLEYAERTEAGWTAMLEHLATIVR